MTSPIRTRRDGHVLEVTLDRPKANAIDLATSRAMGETFKGFRDDPELRVAIVTAAGEKFFCPGWDLKAAAGGDAVDGDYGVGGFGGLQELPRLDKPVIAAVNGICCGGGLELALSCDIILAAEHATFALPEIRSGTVADAASIKLPKRIPYHIAMEMLLTGRWIDAAEAHRWGLVNRVLPGRRADAGRPGDGAADRLRAAARHGGDQGGGARRRGLEVPGRDEPDHQAAARHRRPPLRQRGHRRGLPRLRREARPGVEGPLTPLTGS